MDVHLSYGNPGQESGHTFTVEVKEAASVDDAIIQSMEEFLRLCNGIRRVAAEQLYDLTVALRPEAEAYLDGSQPHPAVRSADPGH